MRSAVSMVFAGASLLACGASPPRSIHSTPEPRGIVAKKSSAAPNQHAAPLPEQRFASSRVSWVFADPERQKKLEAAFPEISTAVTEAQRELELPGLAVGVIIDGRLAHVAAAGYADVEAKRPIDGDTVFRIGSVSKPVTALAILQLRDAGKLALDDPIVQHLPELGKLVYPTQDSPLISVRHLLTHSSGLPRNIPHPTAPAEAAVGMTSAQLLAALDGVTLEHAPGSTVSYSNLGFAILGALIERVTRQRYQTWVKEKLLGPMGIESAAWSREDVPAARLASPYERGADGTLKQPKHERLGIGDASGGLYLSTRDLARWVAFNLSAYPARDGHDPGPVRRASVRESHQPNAGLILGLSPPFTTPPSRRAEPWASTHALAWNESAICDLGRLIEKNGLVESYQTEVGFFPEAGVGIIVQTNTGWHADLKRRAFFDVLKLLKESGGLVKRVATVDESPAFERALSQLLSVQNSWDETKYAAMLTPRHKQAVPAQMEKDELAGYAARHGHCTGGRVIELERANVAKYAVDCERGRFTLWIHLEDGLIDGFWGQSRGVSADRKVSRAAQAVLSKLGGAGAPSHATIFAASFQNGSAFAVRAKRHRDERGRCTLGKLQWRDGNGWHRFELSCQRGRTSALVVKTDPQGKVDGLRLERDFQGVCDPALLGGSAAQR